jgi:hypothetical protein
MAFIIATPNAHEFEFVKSQRGHDKLVFSGYIYKLNKKRDSAILLHILKDLMLDTTNVNSTDNGLHLV